MVAYSPPFKTVDQDSREHKKLLTALAASTKAFDKMATVIIMGDFNSRLPSLTGDHSASKGNLAKRTPKMMEFINDLGLKVMTNKEQQGKGDHYTYFGSIAYDDPTQGKSVNDLIMIKESNKERLTNYKVHKHVHLGSDHRLVTANITNVSCENKSVWEKDNKQSILWDEKTKEEYKKKLGQNTQNG